MYATTFFFFILLMLLLLFASKWKKNKTAETVVVTTKDEKKSDTKQEDDNKSKRLCVYYCEIEKCNSCYLRYSAQEHQIEWMSWNGSLSWHFHAMPMFLWESENHWYSCECIACGCMQCIANPFSIARFFSSFRFSHWLCVSLCAWVCVVYIAKNGAHRFIDSVQWSRTRAHSMHDSCKTIIKLMN